VVGSKVGSSRGSLPYVSCPVRDTCKRSRTSRETEGARRRALVVGGFIMMLSFKLSSSEPYGALRPGRIHRAHTRQRVRKADGAAARAAPS
jgi:hypothetical protein